MRRHQVLYVGSLPVHTHGPGQAARRLHFLEQCGYVTTARPRLGVPVYEVPSAGPSSRTTQLRHRQVLQRQGSICGCRSELAKAEWNTNNGNHLGESGRLNGPTLPSQRRAPRRPMPRACHGNTETYVSANTHKCRQAVAILHDTLTKHEAIYSAVPTQIDGALFCRTLRAQLDSVLGSALEEPVTLERAADASGYSAEHLRRLIREGQVPTYRQVGERKHLVLLSEVPVRRRGARSARAEATSSPMPPVRSDSVWTGPAATASGERPTRSEMPPTLALLSSPEYNPNADARSALARAWRESLMSTTNTAPFEITVQVRREWQVNDKGCWSASFTAHGMTVRIQQRKAGANFERVFGNPECWGSLQTVDREEAEKRGRAFLCALIAAQAESHEPEKSTKYASVTSPSPTLGGLTLGQLWHLYSESAAFAKNKEHTKEGDRSRVRALLAGFGEAQVISRLDGERVTQYLLDRADGGIAYERPSTTAAGGTKTHQAKRVGKRSQEADVRLLKTMVNWALNTHGPDGRYMLEVNPMRGFKAPRETSPERPVATHERYVATMQALHELAQEATDAKTRHLWIGIRLALMLVAFSGRRISAVLKMRWSDVNVSDGKFMASALRFRRENDRRPRSVTSRS